MTNNIAVKLLTFAPLLLNRICCNAQVIHANTFFLWLIAVRYLISNFLCSHMVAEEENRQEKGTQLES